MACPSLDQDTRRSQAIQTSSRRRLVRYRFTSSAHSSFDVPWRKYFGSRSSTYVLRSQGVPLEEACSTSSSRLLVEMPLLFTLIRTGDDASRKAFATSRDQLKSSAV